ncbi:MAG: hypothetical protein EPN99_16625 [Frankiales bacterium]|nr:MAG: hypothetical protein EPN99_16625 [Frankiales bacterium]
MRTRLATFALAGTLGLSGAAGVALLAPAVSHAATGDSSTLGSALRDALAGLVGDGTITQAQADKVAAVLEQSRPMGGPGRGGHGRGGHGLGPVHLPAAAEALGMTGAELRAAAEGGKSLADLAEEKGVPQDTLVDALVAAATERLAQAVTDGRLTQEQADARAADLETRITASLDDPICRPGGRGPRGGSPAPEETASQS